MTASPVENSLETEAHRHAAFFRQSGWLMVANISGGLMALGVHFLAKKVSESQYSIFVTLLMVTVCLPTLPLQMVFAQQTARALATGRERQLASMIRLTWLWTFGLWVVVAGLVMAFQGRIVERWGLTNPAALWVTLLALLVSVWTPMFLGVLQGRQDFFWMGWSLILAGMFRLAAAVALVFSFRSGATGMMIGTLIGLSAGVGVSIWQSRDLWSLPGMRFNGWSLLRQVLPLVFGFGACQFMFTSDTMFAKAYFTGDAMAPYVAAGTMSRALLWLVLPLAAVMFPKIVHSTVKAERINSLGVVLAGTAFLALCGGIGLYLLGPWVIRLVYTQAYVASAVSLLPWYVAAMVPLALANVLLNELLGRERIRVVPVVVAVAVAYGCTLPLILNHFPGKLVTVLQTLGIFNVLLLVVSAWGAFAGARPKAARLNPHP